MTAARPMATPKGWFRGTLLFWNAMITVPVFSILYYKIMYWSSIYYAVHNQNTYLLAVIVAYSLYILIDPSPTQGGWASTVIFPSSWWQRWCNRCSCFRLLAEYFDTELIHEKELDPKQPYIFVYHPHGIIGVGICAALATDGAGFDQRFPGLPRKSVTLNATFLTPIFREWIIANGFISANKSTLQHVLQKQQQSIVLVPGGAAEALYTQPGTMTLHLTKRHGFVRLAMETNTPLVPCLGFGENDIFDTLVTRKSDTGWRGIVWSMQQAFLKATGVSPPIITNPIPRPVKLSVVVGAPLIMDATKSVKENHSRYVEELTLLYDRHAAKVGFGHVALEIK